MRQQGELQVEQRTVELNAANQSLRDLTSRLLQLQDDERRRIARELHDSVGQMLVALNMNLSALGGDIERLAKTANTVKDSTSLVESLTSEIRTISHLLHPPLLDEAGLASALLGFLQMGCAAIGASLASVLRLQPFASLAVILTAGSALALLAFLPVALRQSQAGLGGSSGVPESTGG